MKLLALTGAGVSAQSGIPTFTEQPGLRDKLSRDYYLSHRRDFFDTIISMRDACEKAQPNAAHIALARYHIPVVTMNIDGLHLRAGSGDAIEIHGNLRDIYCKRCGTKYGYDAIRHAERCEKCGGELDSDIVLYGDSIPRLYDALSLAEACDTLLVVGTSYYTSTAGYVTETARAAGAKIILINEDAAEAVPRFLRDNLK